MSGATTRPRLVHPPAADDILFPRPRSRGAGKPAAAVLSAADPRWVLALRADEAMDGEMLEPGRRDRLIRLGRTLGLNAFESNLVIAIVQDRARRGLGLHGSADSLVMVPTTGRRRRSRWPVVAWWVTATLVLELLIAWSMLG